MHLHAQLLATCNRNDNHAIARSAIWAELHRADGGCEWCEGRGPGGAQAKGRKQRSTLEAGTYFDEIRCVICNSSSVRNSETPQLFQYLKNTDPDWRMRRSRSSGFRDSEVITEVITESPSSHVTAVSATSPFWRHRSGLSSGDQRSVI